MLISSNLLNFVLRNGDDRLILSHRLAELCGHAPILEEDIALTNIALDVLGQAILFYKYAAELENNGKTEDYYAYKRNEREFKNLLLVEQPNEDFAYVIARQFYFDTYEYFFYEELINSKDKQLSAIAEKSIKETKYHLRHSSQWMLYLGDGTEESHNRLTNACNYLWMYTGEMFQNQDEDLPLIEQGIIPDLNKIKPKWIDAVSKVKEEAQLGKYDPNSFMQKGGRLGNHTEYLGHILSEMQYLTRAYPEAKW